MKELTKEHYQWMQEHEAMFRGNWRPDRMQILKIYEIYNTTFNANKRPEGCGNCRAKTMSDVWKVYTKQRDNKSII